MNERQLRDDIQALKDLVSSRGWQIIVDALHADISSAAITMSADPRMPRIELDYRRAAIAAANQLLHVPERLEHRLINELAVMTATKP